MKHRRLALAVAVTTSVLALSACATPAGAGGGSGAAPDAPPGFSLGTSSPGLPAGDVVAQGTVMDVGGTAELCLGAVMESYPPQCSGIPLVDWSWDGVEGGETSGAVRWGSYAVQGVYDGAGFRPTQPPMLLALYDPIAPEDPTGGKPGTTDEDTLLGIQDQLPDRLGGDYLSSAPRDGRLWVQVVWDDGTWQKAADDDFGPDVVVIQSALRAIG